MENCIIINFNKYENKNLAEKDLLNSFYLLSNMDAEILIKSPMAGYFEIYFHYPNDGFCFLELDDEERDIISSYRSGENL